MTQSLSIFEEQSRISEEDSDNIKSVIPPRDIVAFNELRSCADLFRLYKKRQLDLNPDFQRGIVWSNKSQTLFVDSLIKQLPIPSLCISLDIRTQKRLIIDGLQRIATIVKFLDEDNDWRLSRTDDIDERISGKKRSEIQLNNNELFEIFENVTIPVTVLRCDYANKAHMEYLFQIFHRLNSGGNKLFNQEIRNCIYQGSFNTYLKKAVRSNLWKFFLNVDDEKIDHSRFAHEELLLRFFAFFYNTENYTGKLAVFLNTFMESNKDISEATIKTYSELLDETLIIINQSLNVSIKDLSKTALEALLIAVANNINTLKSLPDEAIVDFLHKMVQAKEFSMEELSEGLSRPEKVKSRFKKAIRIFSGND